MPGSNLQMEPDVYADVRIVLLAGGVGGAKLADGFARILPAENLTIIVNTGDDFEHLGLTICPDLDTVMYTLAGEANPETGWGRAGESWRTFDEVARLNGPGWFRLGDLDLATHLIRTHLLDNGSTLTEVFRYLCSQFGVLQTVLPMTNNPAPTMIESEEGLIPFQNWFVENQWQPAVHKVHLPEDVRASRSVAAALEQADFVIIAPSNPFVSIDPILNVYPIRSMVADLPRAVVAVSPIIGGQAVKGPAAKMMRDRGMPVTAEAVAGYYEGLIDVFVYDKVDEGSISGDAPALLCTETLMRGPADRIRLAREIMQFTTELVNQ